MYTVLGRLSAFSAGAAARVVAAGSAAVIVGAWFFQYVLTVQPCPLCLEQRKFHYAAIALASGAAIAAARHAPRRLIAGVLVLAGFVLLFGAAVAIYHSGVEWKWWPGPQDCTGSIASFGTAGSLLDQMQKTSIVRCDEVGFRFLGLSLAGYNAILSTLLGVAAVRAGVKEFTRGKTQFANEGGPAACSIQS
jgi:disulfide bond formation protein DsbB